MDTNLSINKSKKINEKVNFLKENNYPHMDNVTEVLIWFKPEKVKSKSDYEYFYAKDKFIAILDNKKLLKTIYNDILSFIPEFHEDYIKVFNLTNSIISDLDDVNKKDEIIEKQLLLKSYIKPYILDKILLNRMDLIINHIESHCYYKRINDRKNYIKYNKDKKNLFLKTIIDNYYHNNKKIDIIQMMLDNHTFWYTTQMLKNNTFDIIVKCLLKNIDIFSDYSYKLERDKLLEVIDEKKNNK